MRFISSLLIFLLTVGNAWAVDLYWYGGSGNISSGTSHWSTNSGNSPTATHANPTSSDNCIFDVNSASGDYTVTVDATANCADITFANPTGGKPTLAGSSVLNVYGNFTLVSGMGFTKTGTIAFNGTSAITTAGVVIPSTLTLASAHTRTLQDNLTLSTSNTAINRSGGGVFAANGKTVTLTNSTGTVSGTFTGTSSFYNLTKAGTAAKTDTMALGGNIEVTNVLAITGQSAVNRVFVSSDTKGTPRTITAASLTGTDNVDFQDITAVGAANWDLHTLTVGDAGGNAGITCSTPITAYYKHGTGTANKNWSGVPDGNCWFLATNGGGGQARVPLPQDLAVFDANSYGTTGKTVTQDMPRIGAVDWSGVTNTPTWARSTVYSFYGSQTFVAGMSLSGNTLATYEGRGSSTYTSASGLTDDRSITINAPGGTLTWGAALTSGSSRTLTILTGNWSDGGYATSIGAWAFNTTGTKSINRTGTTTLTGNVTAILTGVGTGTTIIANSGPIKLTGTLTAARDFRGGGLTYGDVWVDNAGAFSTNFTGSNTFGDFKISNNRTVLFTAGTTTTATTWTLGSGVTIGSITNATHTLAKAGGGYITAASPTLSYSVASPAVSFFATGTPTDNGNNSGWIFATPITGQTSIVSSTPGTYYYDVPAGLAANATLTTLKGGGAGSFSDNGDPSSIAVQGTTKATANGGTVSGGSPTDGTASNTIGGSNVTGGGGAGGNDGLGHQGGNGGAVNGGSFAVSTGQIITVSIGGGGVDDANGDPGSVSLSWAAGGGGAPLPVIEYLRRSYRR